MECRICYETTRPLLQNVCKCKGSQGAVHQKCLRGWMEYSNTTSCEICKIPFSLQPVSPFAWRFLSSTALDVFLLAGFLYIPPTMYRYIHTILASLYAYSYFPYIYEFMSISYAKKWFHLILITNNRVEFPLAILLNILLLFWNPWIMFVYNPYRRAWYIHQMIAASC